jgi:multiple sugar transport system permease protein
MLRRITLPLMTPVIFFQLILGLIGAMQVLDAPILIHGTTDPLSGRVQMPATRYMYMIYVFAQVFDFQRYGYGTALAWIIFIVVLIVTLVVLWSSKFWVHYEVAQEGDTP